MLYYSLLYHKEMSNTINTIVDPCPICLETFTAVTRREIKCQYCNVATCSKCIERYFLNSIEDPHCLHCRRAWSRATLNTICTRTFLNQTYYKYRQNILLNREKSFLPQMQAAAERELRARELEKEDLIYAKEYAEIMLRFTVEQNKIMAKRTAISNRIRRIRNGRNEEGTSDDTVAADTTRAKFVRRCTAPDCKGFLSSVWKCGLCSNWICPECFEVKGTEKDTEHTCKKEALETANLIKKDTKPCPSCGEMIMKSDGCDQMWCTSCHSPFSWRTGQLITTGIIHNPHYFQWLSKGGQAPPRNPGDIPCGGLPDVYRISRKIADSRVSATIREEFMKIFRTCAHIIDVERRHFERHLAPNNNEDIGVKYLLKEIDETVWKQTLAKREKARQRSNEIRDILDAFNGATIDLIRRIDIGFIYSKTQMETLLSEIINELNALREFTVEALFAVSRSFNCKVPLINDKWEVKYGKPITMGGKRKKKDEKSSEGGGTDGSDDDSVDTK